ncbi:MAG TPA: hypothetical protein VK808_06465 [Bacteroidia bacterium]|jgi:hypothetical protein|nr:hypothetical protein [Bacteroidia bacterium]
MPKIDWLRSNWLFLAVIVFGLFLRLVWVNDMEWKSDEQWMFNKAHEAATSGHWLKVGMESGGGIVNPGLSSAIFTAIAYFFDTPTGMAGVVQWLNVISILCFLLFIIYKVEKEQQNIWLWGLALASVSPLAVLFSRKIWAQDVLPIFCFLVIWTNANRNKKWGAFLWGLFGALIGQIHMSGFFYAAGLAIFTIYYDHRNKQPFKWGYWLAGSAIGAIGLIPWLQYITTHSQPSNMSLAHIFQFNFYIYWLFDAHGINTMYSLKKEFWNFVKEPFIAGHATYLVGILHLVLAASGLYTIFRLGGYVKRIILYIKQKQLLSKLTTNLSSADFYLLSVFLGLGILMTFSGIIVCQHYLIVAFPFSYIFMAKIFQQKKKLMIAIIIAQLLVTVSFMLYIHTHNGAKDGDYGMTYGSQLNKT